MSKERQKREDATDSLVPLVSGVVQIWSEYSGYYYLHSSITTKYLGTLVLVMCYYYLSYVITLRLGYFHDLIGLQCETVLLYIASGNI